MRINKHARTIVDGEPAPDRNDEYRFYQALLGVWPEATRADEDLVARLQAYMIKSVKEAKRHSSWINPNEVYEQAVAAFVERVLAGPAGGTFLAAFLPFQAAHRALRPRQLARRRSSLKIASPGVPDFYQGSELWDFNLVDPDNRRPVDFPRREQMLDTRGRRAASSPRSSVAAPSRACADLGRAAPSSCCSPPPALRLRAAHDRRVPGR